MFVLIAPGLPLFRNQVEVVFRDDSTAQIKGKGNIDLKMTSGNAPKGHATYAMRENKLD